MSAHRELIVVDLETTGLGDNAAVLEVAAVNVQSGREPAFVPFVDRAAMAAANSTALKINRYYERGVFESMLSERDTEIQWGYMCDLLRGNTFGGSNPSFDAHFVSQQQGRINVTSTGTRHIGKIWHHRLADLSAYAGAAFQLAPNQLIGLADVCERLGVDNEGEHTALGDARATAECFRKLWRQYASQS